MPKYKPQHIATTLEDQQHGTMNAYKCGCRCDACTEAYRNYYRKLRAQRKAKQQ